MKKFALLLISVSVATLVVAGVALAVTKRCSDTIYECRGTSKDDTLIGTRNSDDIFGLNGDDKLDGRDGPDNLFGDEGDDRLLGGKDRDSLNPDRGDDALFGGPGADVYSFRLGWGRDTIVDEKQEKKVGNEVYIGSLVTSDVVLNLVPSKSRSEIRAVDGRNTVNWPSGTRIENVQNYGQGDDVIRGNNAGNGIYSEDLRRRDASADKVYALGGGDFVSVLDQDGEDLVDCGEGNDTVYYNPGDTLRNCEVQRTEF